MKFEYIGPNLIEYVDGKMFERPVNTYGGDNILSGEVIELEGFFAEKALANPMYRQVKPGPKPKKIEEKQEIAVIEEVEIISE